MGSQLRQERLILLVEDDVDTREVFTLCLEHAGYRVLQANDGIQALPLLKGTKPDAVITGLLMPHMNGAQLAQAIKSNADLSAIPIGLLTETPPSASMESLAHFSRALTKPCSIDDLVAFAEFLVTLGATAPLHVSPAMATRSPMSRSR